MGKASSSKKVAKAARAGGGARTSTGRRWGFPAALASIVVVGIGVVVFVRVAAEGEEVAHPALGDHWHDAYGIYVCDAFEPPQFDLPGARHDIHTHEDGLMHIHPASAALRARTPPSASSRRRSGSVSTTTRSPFRTVAASPRATTAAVRRVWYGC